MPQSDESHEEARKRLDARLTAAEAAQVRRTGGDAHAGIAQGYRFVGEVVGGVLGGTGLGWFLDQFANTGPWGLIGGLLIGTGLSLFVAVKTAARASRIQLEKLGPLPSVPDDDEEEDF